MDDLELAAAKVREAAALIRRNRDAKMDDAAVGLIRLANEIEKHDGDIPVRNPVIEAIGNSTVGFYVRVTHRGQKNDYSFSGRQSMIDALVEAANEAKESEVK